MKASTYYINLMKERGNSLINLKEFLKNDTGENYSKVVRLLSKNRQLKNIIYNNFFPQSINTVYTHYLEQLPLVKILLWFCNILANHSEVLWDFEKKKIQFEQLFLAGKYEEAYELTELIRKQFGMSIWLLDCYGLLESFGLKNNEFQSTLDSETLNWYRIITLKNRKSERQQQYIHRINYILKNLDLQSAVYYKYKLFSEMPFNDIKKADENWKSVLVLESSKSLIDIYLVTVDCLQYYLNCLKKEKLSIFIKHINIISEIDTPICRILVATFEKQKPENVSTNVAQEYIQLIQQQNFSKIVELFSTRANSYTCFNTYIYTAIAALHTDCTLDNIQNHLYGKILKCIYDILKKSNVQTTFEALEELKSISRVFRFFGIHKGICIFLDVESNASVDYFFNQQITTYDDEALLSFGLANNASELSPYFSLCEVATFANKNLQKICENAIEQNVAVNYYEEALIKMNISDFSEKLQISSAISLFFRAYIKNPFLITSINIDNIRNFLDDKIKKQEALELEELCYIFIDIYYKDLRKPCFLNFIDTVALNEPLEIVQKSCFDKKAIWFYLANICSIEMLNSLYMLFDSSDEARDYRIKICQYILSEKTEYEKRLKIEMEDLAKNKAMHQRLLNVDRSRVSINSRMIKEEVFDDIEYQLDGLNSQISENISSPTKDSYVIINPKVSSYSRLYETYAKSFCFSQSGLDASLSTRVRHGAFSNQIFRPFSENCLIYSENNKNSFFEKLFVSGKVNQTLKPVLNDLHKYIQEHVEYFRQHTLKVFIDERIDGAVFDYSDVDSLSLNLYLGVLTGSVINTNNAIEFLHKILINKTNSYLEKIRVNYLPELERNLLDKLTSFSYECEQYANDDVTKKEIGRKIAQCKTALQNEFKTVSSWFYLSENEEWEDYKFDDLLEICIEITKKLFSGFDKVKIEKNVDNDFVYDGKTFRNNTDIILILLNNAFLHSGFDEKPNDLHINCTVTSDSNYIYFAVVNNLSDLSDISNLKNKIDRINEDYKNEIYKTVNTRQEGGMGLYKIMIMLYNSMKVKDAFYMSVTDHKVRVEIKLRKELVCNEKNIISG